MLVDTGALRVDGTSVKPARAGVRRRSEPTGSCSTASDETRLLLLGGPPFGERIVMWWNFVGRDHDEIAEYRRQWQALLGGEEQERFSLPDDDRYPEIPAPELPRGVRLTPRM